MNEQQKLTDQIDLFLATTGMSPTMFGKQAANDSALLFDMANGRAIKTRTVDKIKNFMLNFRRNKNA